MSPEMNDFAEFVHRLTDNARGSLQQADMMAQTLGSAYIGTEHLLLGVLSQSDSVGAKLLMDSGVNLERAQVALKLTPKNLVVSAGSRGLSETAKLTLRMSWNVAQEFNQDFCGTEHILYSILTQKNARATVLLRDMNVNVEEVVGELENYLARQNFEYDAAEGVGTKPKRGRGGALGTYGIDLTELARAGELDPVVGRDTQIKRMITVLGRRTKNNPVLIGEPGVGKTAIVEGLAQRIVAEDVPDYLFDARVVSLDLAGMIAGTKYRGEFEERLKKVLSELSDDASTIVFIDELHLLVGAGAAEGSIDAANMLKPALARGQIRLIGATTFDEYRKHIEKDAALERRLQPVIVPEPSNKEAGAILKGLKGHYETHHGVKISDEIIEDAVYLANRYVHDRFMPDKVIDVIDEAAAYVRVARGKAPAELRKLTREAKVLADKIEDAVASEDYERAALYKTRHSQLQEKLQSIRLEDADKKALTMTHDDLAEAIAIMADVPAAKIKKSEAAFLVNLEKHLAAKIVGQSEALGVVARSIRRGRSGIADTDRPIGSFIFMGPTGVGKTELARVIAREVFGSDKSLIKIDMSEFGERHTAARLVGAPAGFVGYEDGGQLTDKIRRQPYSVVVFDEIEKAHPEVFNMLLQILEDGRLTDAKGRSVDFSNTIIILTSNLGAEAMQREARLGFDANSASDRAELEHVHAQNQELAMKALREKMRPELINRFDAITVFQSLSKPEVQTILDLQLDKLNQRLSRQGVSLTVRAPAKRWLLERGYDVRNGARPMRRVIQDELEHRIAEGLLAGTYQKGHTLVASLKKGTLVLDTKAETVS